MTPLVGLCTQEGGNGSGWMGFGSVCGIRFLPLSLFLADLSLSVQENAGEIPKFRPKSIGMPKIDERTELPEDDFCTSL